MSQGPVTMKRLFAWLSGVTLVIAMVSLLTPRASLAENFLFFQNSSTGKVVSWTLDGSGRLKDNVQGSGWNYVSPFSPGVNWRLVGIQYNADTQQRTHLLWKNAREGKLNYWALNSNGTLANQNHNDGWAVIGRMPSSWRLVGVQYNGDKQGHTQLILSNESSRLIAYWKLDENGRLLNTTRGEGWNLVFDKPYGHGWRLSVLQENGDHQGNDHLIWQNTAAGQRIYWKLNSQGQLANRTQGDGWDYLTTNTIPTSWSIAGLQKNADKQNTDHLLQYHSGTGKLSYWKLNANGTMKNTQLGDGWGYVADMGYPAPWVMASIMTNADSQGNDHLIWQNTSNGKMIYWKLDSAGQLKNKIKGDGWDYISSWQPAPSWRIGGNFSD